MFVNIQFKNFKVEKGFLFIKAFFLLPHGNFHEKRTMYEAIIYNKTLYEVS